MSLQEIVVKAQEILGDTNRLCCMYNGSLFVSCDENHARSIFNTLYKNLDGRVRVEYVQSEDTYIYDFVA